MKALSLSLLVLFSIDGYAQSKDINLEKLMDEIFPVQDENFNYEELYETYAQWLANPLNLNTATEEQLQSLLILNSNQLFDFIQYRNENGPLLSLYELQVIPSFNEATIRRLEPFVRVEEMHSNDWKGLISRVLNEKNNYWVTRLERTRETRAGFQNDADELLQYMGKPTKIYSRFRVSAPGDFSFGITTESDAGEKFRWNPSSKQFGFDYLSWHAHVQNKGKITNLIVGDYQAQFGQGLTLGGGFGMGKGSEPVTAMRRSNLGFLPYTSAVEFGFFHGAATSIKLNKFVTAHGFYSTTFRDGHLNDDAETSQTVSSLYLSGFHRTANELNVRKNLREQNLGGVIQFKRNALDAGLIIHHTQFQLPINRNPSLYNQFSFQGTTNTNIGGYANYSWRNYTAFSEFSQSVGAGHALVAGVLASLSPSLDLAFHYRDFCRNYYSFYSNAISENSTPQNEQGFYWGVKYRFSKIHGLQGYIDVFKFPWLKFKSYQPSFGNELMLRYNFIPTKGTLVFVQIRQENKVRNLSADAPNYTTATGKKTNLWLNADYALTNWLSLKTRLQWVGYTLGKNTSEGFALVQDVNAGWKKFSLSSRVALFHTDDYDTRIYLYERDAWLAFSIPALQGIGLRRYILLQYQANSKLDFWFRWANTTYENKDSIGSQGEEITGSARNDFKLQVRIKF